MNEQEVRELIGDNNWSEFLQWMYGQTVSINPDGSTDYYDSDVIRFKEQLER